MTPKDENVLHYHMTNQCQLRRFTAIHESQKRPHAIVKCPSNAHFRISPEVVDHSGNFPYSIFPICIWTYYSFGVLNSQHIHASWADSTHVYYEKIKVFLDARRTKLEIFKTAKIVFMGNFWTK